MLEFEWGALSHRGKVFCLNKTEKKTQAGCAAKGDRDFRPPPSSKKLYKESL